MAKAHRACTPNTGRPWAAWTTSTATATCSAVAYRSRTWLECRGVLRNDNDVQRKPETGQTGRPDRRRQHDRRLRAGFARGDRQRQHAHAGGHLIAILTGPPFVSVHVVTRCPACRLPGHHGPRHTDRIAGRLYAQPAARRRARRGSCKWWQGESRVRTHPPNFRFA